MVGVMMTFCVESCLEEVIRESRESIVRSLDLRINKKYRSRFSGEDVFQIACEKVARRLSEFRGSTKNELACWLGSVAYCQLVNEFDRANAKKRSLQSTVEYSDGSSTDENSSRLEALADKEEAHFAVKELLAFVARLPERQRVCIHLRFFSRLSCEQVAERLDIHVEAVKGLTKRGLQNIRKETTVKCSRDVIIQASEILQSECKIEA